MKGVRQFCSGLINNKYYYVTTPIYYVNAAPHLGHLYSSVVADFIQRWHRMCNDSAILFSTGTDEHGTKIQKSAAQNQTNIYDYCTDISQKYLNLSKTFNVDYTYFIRTTDPRHKEAVSAFWNAINKNGFIYLSRYEGWYCVSDETFLSRSQLTERAAPGGERALASADSGHPVEWTQEQNYMFRLSALQGDLRHWLRSNERCVRPKRFHRQLLEMVDSEATNDVSVSRPSARVPWAVPVPGDAGHTVYVWLDALASYLTVAGYPDTRSERFRSCWPPDVQVIGKDILKFHGIYWPAFLLAAGLEPPRTIYCHSHWTVDGQKMSKSRGNVVCPLDAARALTADGLRYFLLREGVAHSDGNYSELKATRVLNAELADSLGNLLSRCCGQALNPEQEFPRLDPAAFETVSGHACTGRLLQAVHALPDAVRGRYEEFQCHRAVDAVVAVLHAANLFFETLKPWQLRRSPGAARELHAVLHVTMETLRVCGILLQPVVPVLSAALLDKLAVPAASRTWAHLRPYSWERPTEPRPIAPHSAVLYRRLVAEQSTVERRVYLKRHKRGTHTQRR